MRQKGFATIFGLCLILVFALIVKGIQEAETNHAREVLNFELEQALQSAAESGILEAAEEIRLAEKNNSLDSLLPFADGSDNTKKIILNESKSFKHGEKKIDITVETWGENGKIYFYDANENEIITFTVENENGNLFEENYLFGVYLMSRATIKGGVLGEDIYRRVYGYFLWKNQDEYEDNTKYTVDKKAFAKKFDKLLNDDYCEFKVHFMELPTMKVKSKNRIGIITKS